MRRRPDAPTKGFRTLWVLVAIASALLAIGCTIGTSASDALHREQGNPPTPNAAAPFRRRTREAELVAPRQTTRQRAELTIDAFARNAPDRARERFGSPLIPGERLSWGPLWRTGHFVPDEGVPDVFQTGGRSWMRSRTSASLSSLSAPPAGRAREMT